MSVSQSNPIKPFNEIFDTFINNDTSPEETDNSFFWLQIKDVLLQLKNKAAKVNTLCRREEAAVADNPLLIQGLYLRPEFTDSLISALLDIEELICLFSNFTDYDPLETEYFIGSCKSQKTSSVSIRLEENRILIKMPYLPARYAGVSDLSNQLLAAKLLHTNNLPVWPQWEAKYTHVFPSATSDIPKDVDNYSYKRTNDILGYALGTSDNALRFSMQMTCIFTDDLASGTYIEITPKSSENADLLISAFGGDPGNENGENEEKSL